MPHTTAMVYLQGLPITSKTENTLRCAYLSQDLRKYMTQRENWNEHIADTIWWEAHKCALNRMTTTNKTRIQKFVNRCLPTNKKLHDQDPEHAPTCPLCTVIETNPHVSTCAHQSRSKLRGNLRRNITKTLDKYDTHVHIKECMLLGLTQTLQGGNTEIDSVNLSFTPTGPIKKALDEQNAIGWNNFYRGRIASSWNAVQQGHCKTRNNGKQDTTKWATAIITTLWHGFLQLWEARKDDQHGRDSAQKQEKERTLLL